MSAFAVLALASALASGDPAQEPLDLSMVTRIRTEGLEHSQVMDTLWHLTDLYGPRLTNSPQQRRAAEWARDRLTEFGLADAHLEPWGEFGLGWTFERCVVALTVPDYMPLIALPKAWTRGTEGEIVGEPVHVQADSVEDLERYRGELAGKIVLFGEVREVGTPFEPYAHRLDAEELAESGEVLHFADADDEDDADDRRQRRAGWRRARGVRDKAREMMEEEGVAVVLEADGGRRNDYGVITLGSGGSRDPEEPRALPQVVVAAEHFNRMVRLLEHEERVEVSVDVRATFHDEDTQGHNVIAEIPGTDPLLRGQVVMLGAHFDSWHPATGATDNGCSSAVVMEAARILAALDVRPRRTVRVALWTGEEQGLLGSKGYVKRHFGDRESMALEPEHASLAAYFNLDNGGGRIRGVYIEGNAALRPVFARWLEPFHDLGATEVTLRGTGGTDHLSFDGLGLPGFQFIQDPLDYGARTHHTNMDLYERVRSEDVRQAAVVMASFAYCAAMRDEMLPRKPLPEPRERPERKPEPEAEAAPEATPEAGRAVPTADASPATPEAAPQGAARGADERPADSAAQGASGLDDARRP